MFNGQGTGAAQVALASGPIAEQLDSTEDIGTLSARVLIDTPLDSDELE